MLLPNKKSASSIAVFFMFSLMLVLQPQYAVADDDLSDTAKIGLVAGGAGLVGAIIALISGLHHFNQSENNTPGQLATITVTASATNIPTNGPNTATLTATAVDSSGTPIPNLIINWSVTSTKGTTGMVSLASPSSTTAANGMTTITATGQTAGNVAITATYGNITSNTVVLGVYDREPSTITVTSSPATVTSGTAATVTAVATDVNGIPTPNIVITWALSSNNNVTISSTSGITDINGRVTTVATGVTDGNVTITATATFASGTVADTTQLSVVPGPASILIINPPLTVVSGGTVQFTATVTDADGNPINGGTVAWTITPGATDYTTKGSATFTSNNTASASSTTNSNGYTTITINGVQAGGVTVAATDGAATNTVPLEVTSGAATKITITPNPTTASTTIASGSELMLTATATDSNGNTVQGVNISWQAETVSGSTGTATVPTSSLATGSDGTTTVTVTGGVEGDVTITATAPLASSGTIILTIDGPGPLDHITVTPNVTTIASTGNAAFTAIACDISGNPIPGTAITWTAVTVGTGTATFPGNVTTTTATTGPIGATTIQATGGSEGSVIITATATLASGLPTSQSVTLSIGAPGALDHIGVTSTSATIASDGTTTLTATAYDINGNIIVNPLKPILIKWTAVGTTTATATLSAYTTPIESNGTTTITATGGAMGNVTITAAASGATSGTTTLNINSPGSFATIKVTPPSQNIASGSTMTFTATMYDKSGNPITNIPTLINWDYTPATGSNGSVTVSPNNAETVNGQVSTTITGGLLGVVNIIASANNGSITGSAALDVNSLGALDHIVATSNPTTVTSGSTSTLTATAYDISGNPIPNTDITWTTTSTAGSTGTATFPNNVTTKTGTNGQTTITATGVTAGSTTITATSGSVNGTTTLTINPGLPTNIAISTNNSSVSVSSNTTATATVTDVNGNLVADGTIIGWSSTGTSIASLSGTTSITTNGKATITVMTSQTTGTATINAFYPSTGSTLNVSIPLTVTPGPLNSLTLSPLSTSSSPVWIEDINGQIGTQMFTVTAYDQFLNPIPNILITWSLGGSGGTLTEQSSVTSSIAGTAFGTASTTVQGTIPQGSSGTVSGYLSASAAGISPLSSSFSIAQVI